MAQSIIYKGQKYVRVDSDYINNKLLDKIKQTTKDLIQGNNVTASDIKISLSDNNITIETVVGFRQDDWQKQLANLKRDMKNYKAISGIKVLKFSVSRFNKQFFSRFLVILSVDIPKLPSNFKTSKEYTTEQIEKAAIEALYEGKYQAQMDKLFYAEYGKSHGRRSEYIKAKDLYSASASDRTLQKGNVSVKLGGKNLTIYDEDGDYRKETAEIWFDIPAKDVLKYI